MRWVQLNGENTKYFHARATERFRHNKISSIADGDGNILVEHEEKAAAFWQSYKNRMGVSYSTATSFSLEHLIQPVEDLQILGKPFSHDEIENVVKFLTKLLALMDLPAYS